MGSFGDFIRHQPVDIEQTGEAPPQLGDIVTASRKSVITPLPVISGPKL